MWRYVFTGTTSPLSKSAFSLIEIMLVVAMISILSSIAIPSFQNYIRRARTSEAGVMVRKMYDAEVAHFHRLNTVANRQGKLVFDIKGSACNFSTGPNCWAFTYSTAYSPSGGIGTPPRGTKEMLTYYPDPNGAGASYDSNPYDWYKSFHSLGLGIDSPSAFAYTISLGVPEVSALLLDPARVSYLSFYADAYGDLNGDGVKSTFRRIGYVDKNGDVAGGGGLYTYQTLE